MLTYKQKLNILKSVGAAQELKGTGIYAFSLGTSNRKMVLMGKTWEEAVEYCSSRGWFIKWELKRERKM